MVLIFLYHQIGQAAEQLDPRGLIMSPQMFEQQMSYLHRKGYRCLGLGEAVRCWREGQQPPKKSFVLTFDDGYLNMYTDMWPILDRFGFTATIFLVAGRAGRQSDWTGQDGPYSAPLLSWAQAREMLGAGFTFGSHTLNHPRLTQLDDEQARQELEQSRKILEDNLGTKIDLLAYPYGNTDLRIQRLTSESGYTAACGIDRGAWGLFNLWRVGCLRTDSELYFRLKTDGWQYRRTWLREQSLLGRPLAQALRRLRKTTGNQAKRLARINPERSGPW